MDENSGILDKVNGEDVGRALASLPDPATLDVGSQREIAIDTPNLGRVLLTAQVRREPRWKRRYWVAIRSELAGESSEG